MYKFLTLKSRCDLYMSATYTRVNTVNTWYGSHYASYSGTNNQVCSLQSKFDSKLDSKVDEICLFLI